MVVRPQAWHHLLSHAQLKLSSPYIVSVGVAAAGMAPPAAPASLLPTYTANLHDLSAFERDYMARCFECLCSNGHLESSEALNAAVQAALSSSPSTTPSHSDDAQWRSLFDLLLLPDGSLFIGWFRHHPLDLRWIRHTEEYVADLWAKQQASMWFQCFERLQSITYTQINHRQRLLPVFNPAERVTRGEAEQDFQLAIRSLHATSRQRYHMEDYILQLCGTYSVSLADARTLMESLARHEGALSTGSATALLRMCVCAYALFGADDAVADELRTTAARVCVLARDSSSHGLLRLAASLLSEKPESSLDAAAWAASCTGPSRTLLAALRASVSVSSQWRDAVHDDQVKHYLSPLCDTLFAEEALMVDVMTSETRTENPEDAKVDTDAASVAAGAPPPTETTLARLYEQCDDAYLSAALAPREQLASAPREPGGGPSLQNTAGTQQLLQRRLAWLPGAGIDVNGCWCALIIHSTVLRVQARLHHGGPQRFRGTNATTATAAAAACDSSLAVLEKAHHLLWVSLIRRCCFVTTEANAYTKYSLLTQLSSLALQPPVSLTLLHFCAASSDGGSSPGPNDAMEDAALLGLMFLLPTLEVRSFYGGTMRRLHELLASDSRAALCYREREVVAGEHVATIRIPASLAPDVAEQLKKREGAVLCIVQAGLDVKDVFFLEDLRDHLHFIVQS